jgi:hypothetical protein
MPGVTFGDFNHDSQIAARRETKPSSRLEAQGQFLEYKKMYHLHSMSVDQHEMERDRNLARRQMIALAQGESISLVSKLRQSFGGALIAIGERIRPQAVSNEPTFNA